MPTNGLVYAPSTPDWAQIRNIEYSYQVSLIADNPVYLRQFMVATQAMQTQSLLAVNAQIAEVDRGILGIRQGISELNDVMQQGFSGLSCTMKEGFDQLGGMMQEGFSLVAAEMQRQNAIMVDIAKLLSTKLEGEAREIRNSALSAVREGCSPEAFDQEGSLREAMQLFRITVEHPMGMRDYVAWFNIGWLHWKLNGNLEEAEKAFATAVRQSMEKKDTYHVLAARHLAYIRLLQDKTDGAYQGIRLALQSDEDNPQNLYTQLLISAQAHNIGEFTTFFCALISNHPNWLEQCLIEPEFRIFEKQMLGVISQLRKGAIKQIIDPFNTTLQLLEIDAYLAKMVQKETLLTIDLAKERVVIADFLAGRSMEQASWPTLYYYLHHWLPRCEKIKKATSIIIDELRNNPRTPEYRFLATALAAVERDATRVATQFHALVADYPDWLAICLAEPQFRPFMEPFHTVITELRQEAMKQLKDIDIDIRHLFDIDTRLAKTVKKVTLLTGDMARERLAVGNHLVAIDLEQAPWPVLHQYLHHWLPRCEKVKKAISIIIDELRNNPRTPEYRFLAIALAAVEGDTKRLIDVFRALITDHPDWLDHCLIEPEFEPFMEQLLSVLAILRQEAIKILAEPFRTTKYALELDARLAKTIQKTTLLTGDIVKECIAVTSFLASMNIDDASWPALHRDLPPWIPRCEKVRKAITAVLDELRNNPRTPEHRFLLIVLAAIEMDTGRMIDIFRALIIDHPDWLAICMTQPELNANQIYLHSVVDTLLQEARDQVREVSDEVNNKLHVVVEMARTIRQCALLSACQQKVLAIKELIDSVDFNKSDWTTLHHLTNKLKVHCKELESDFDRLCRTFEMLTGLINSMISIPAGEFCYSENLIHKYLPTFSITKYPITVAQFRIFCQATKRKMPEAPSWGWQEDHPVVNVTWHDAAQFAAWTGLALPTEEEWEKSARGTDGREYPWGDQWDASRCQYSSKSHNGPGSTSPVGQYPAGASPYGVHDMVGNVSEWCESISGNERVYRGGNWASTYYKATTRRGHTNPTMSICTIGFRCVSRLPNR